MELFEGLRSSYLTEGLSDDEVRMIAAIADLVEAADGENIIREFDEADELYILLGGYVQVTTNAGDPISRLSPGAILGETSLFDAGGRTASVVARGAARLARIPADRFRALMDGQPQIGLHVLRNVGRTLVTRLRSANIQLEAVLGAL